MAFTSTPTYGLLALVARCAWGENAFQVEQCGLAMQEYMASLLGPLRHGEFKFAFSFDMDNRWLPPSLWVTDAGIVVCCVDGTLDLRPVVQYSQSVNLPPERRSVVEGVMAKLGGAVALNMSLIGLMSLVAKHMGSCKQVLRVCWRALQPRHALGSSLMPSPFVMLAGDRPELRERSFFHYGGL